MKIVPKIHWPTDSQFRSFVDTWGWGKTFAFDTETDGLQVIGDCSRDQAHYLGVQPVGTNTVFCFEKPFSSELLQILNQLNLLGHNTRFDIHAMNLQPEKPWADTMVLQYRNNTAGRKSLDVLAKRFDWEKIPTPKELKGPKGKQNQISTVPRDQVALYMADDILFTSWLWEKVYTKPQKDAAVRAGDLAVERTVQRMEARGVRLLLEPLANLGRELAPLVSQNETILRDAGFGGNLNSSPQIQEWLKGLGYKFYRNVWNKKHRKKECKFITESKTVLQPYFERTGDPVIGALIMYRKYLKKKKDFCDTLPGFVQEDGLIHGQIKSTRTITKRFAHGEPNLGQIPKQGTNKQEQDLAEAFRACFTGRSGYYSGADYSQVELRVAAALSGDERMLEAYHNDEDLHTATACATSGKRAEDLPKGERFKAKATNFGILNGMRAKRLSVQIRTTEREAQEFIDRHIQAHPQLHEWMDATTKESDGHRVTELIDGAYMYHTNEGGVNNAVSGKVQGSAAMLMRGALVDLEAADLRPILTVHDEAGCDVKGKGREVAEVMEHSANSMYPELFSDVKFVAEGGDGRTWGDA
jgi:DNA polymerase I-like protein with 3'-5' exonuclease and polymerase domains